MRGLVLLFILVTSSFVTCTAQTMKDRSQALNISSAESVVRLYVERSRHREFDKLVELTGHFSGGKVADKDRTAPSNVKSNGSVKPVLGADDPTGFDGLLEWIRTEFPHSIADQQFSVIEIKPVKNTDSSINFRVYLQKDGSISFIGWVFKLRTIEDKWKIVDIATVSDVDG